MITADCLANRYFLVVDDEEFVRKLVARFLKRFGAADVVEASEGGEARVAIASYEMTFDAVISDVNMRPVNGIELLRAIRTGAGGLKRNIPVLMLTAHGEAELVAEALALDADAFVLKPVERESLIERVVRVLEHSVPIRPVSAYAAPQAVGDQLETVARSIGPAPPTKRLRVAVTALMEPELTPPVAVAHKVTLGEVRANSILAQDICVADSSRLLLAAPMILTKALLDRLKDLHRIHDSYADLLVIEPIA
jgi:CheY-like chemotaxis protein